MEIIKDCWNSIETYNCQYGAHIFNDSTAQIYVNHWLDVEESLKAKFSRRNELGFVGHCLLVFEGVKSFHFEVSTHRLDDQGETVWSKPVSFDYLGAATGPVSEYYSEGSLHGFPSSVSVRIEAERFELHILGKDEPAKGS